VRALHNDETLIGSEARADEVSSMEVKGRTLICGFFGVHGKAFGVENKNHELKKTLMRCFRLEILGGKISSFCCSFLFSTG
jgi:hypothetical protein